LLDADLAELYGVTTKALNQAVKRNMKVSAGFLVSID
jgi:ORF6N domain